MRTLAIVNQKGGCGKTTTAINLAATLARRGRRVLLVDMDPQSHCAAGLGVPESRVERGIGDVLLSDLDRPIDGRDFLWEVGRNLHLAPSTVSLATLEAAAGGLNGLADRDRRLARLLTWLAPRFDLAIIDCPPTIGLLTFNALRAADEVIVPVETGFFSFRGAEKQVATIRKVVERLGRPLPFRMLVTLFDDARAIDRDVLAALREKYGDAMLPVVVRDHDVLREAASLGQAITEYAPQSAAGADFDALADWLLSHPPDVPTSREGPAPTPPEAHALPPRQQTWSAQTIAGLATAPTVPVEARTAGPREVRGNVLASAFGADGFAGKSAPAELPGNRAAELVRRVRGLASRPSPEEIAMLTGSESPAIPTPVPARSSPWPRGSA